MLENEPNDREFHDHATGGHGAGELSVGPTGVPPSVPAALFQPPPVVVFQPPPPPPPTAWEPAQASPPPAATRSAGSSTRSAGSSARAEAAEPSRTTPDSAAGEDAADDGTASGRR